MKQSESRTPHRTARRFGGAMLTVLVIVAVILLNLLFSVFADHGMWQIDETVTRYTNVGHVSMYTPTKPFLDVVRDYVIPMVDEVNEARAAEGKDPVTINIMFCSERDRINAVEKLRYIQYTALALQKEFPDAFKVSYINVEQNPSAVQKYKATSATNIYPHQIIFEFGTEYRVCSYEYFFLKSDENSTDFWAYNGEQDMASLLLAITRAESPIACFTVNHGEPMENCQALRKLVERAGYDVRDIDLEKDPLPEDCRLLITFDPQMDFFGFGHPGETGTSEIDKLDGFLDKAYSFMLFVDSDTPAMPVLDEYLEEWGVKVSRAENESGQKDNYTIRDESLKLDEQGYVPLGVYATGGLGASVTSDMRKGVYPPKVVFPHATALEMSGSYHDNFRRPEKTDKEPVPPFHYGSYYKNGVTRYMHDIFRSTPKATAEAFGKTYEIATEQEQFKYMTITSESRTVKETNYLNAREPSYVCVCGSTEFASDEVLNSATYGNADVLLSTFHSMGREVMPADLEFKAFKVFDVDTKAYQPNMHKNLATTIVLTCLPPVAMAIIGTAVTLKRKFK